MAKLTPTGDDGHRPKEVEGNLRGSQNPLTGLVVRR
jgi:hypothetical protein